MLHSGIVTYVLPYWLQRLQVFSATVIGFSPSVNESSTFSEFRQYILFPDNLIEAGYSKLIKFYASVRLSGVI